MGNDDRAPGEDNRDHRIDADARDVCGAPLEVRQRRSSADFGVVVGIEHYRHVPSLRGAVNDAQAFFDWLCNPAGGGLDPAHARLVVSEPEAGTPLQLEIDRALVEVLDAAAECGGARRLYFYFSGHGAVNPYHTGIDVALLLAQWSNRFARLALSTRRYSSRLCGVGLFEELAIFVDCCRSVSVSAVGVPPTIDDVWKASCGTTTFFAFAAEARQPAFERPEPEGWQGIFTRCLLKILAGSVHGVNAGLLKDRLEWEVAREARKHGIPQCASAENGFSAASCFGHGGTLPMLALAFAKRRGPVELKDGQLQLVGQHVADDAPWRIALPVGLYEIDGGGQGPLVFHHDGREEPHAV